MFKTPLQRSLTDPGGVCILLAYMIAGQVTHAVSSRLQQAGIQLPASPQQQQQQVQALGSSSSSSPLQGPYLQQQQQPVAQLQGTAAAFDFSGMLGGTAGNSSSSSSNTVGGASNVSGACQAVAAGQQQQQQGQDAVVMQTLLLQQQEIKQLQKQNRQLRAAVCKLDPSAVVCRSSSSQSKGNRKSRSRVQGPISSDGVWSD
jgi:hypothetical protein